MQDSTRRIEAPLRQWVDWKNVLEWVLLSEGGHNTAPYMDSHGYATWITVLEGMFGFGWMIHEPQHGKEWISHQDPSAGQWRYIVLRPGQTVFFPSGTIHFVFRTAESQTLALGGHILQWSAIARWMEVVLAQMKCPDITNETMERMPDIVHVAERLIEAKLQEGLEHIGDSGVVQRFVELVEEFKLKYVKPTRRRKKT
ncbi:hypothetical protein QBC43DRAFT_129031 [Cladorrhinum sp. PSN259]|nr:hypothetical protein QBC43DRAFT_129031 [Cladorrhinum sp. PSN259]